MTKLQNIILLSTSSLASVLLLAHLVSVHYAENSSLQLSNAQQIISEGQQSYGRLRDLAARTYQASLQDAALKDVLIRQQITFKNSNTPTSLTPVINNN